MGPCGADVAAPRVDPGRHSTFAALRVPNFRRYFAGQLVSVCGTAAHQAGLAWLVLHDFQGRGRELGLLSLFAYSPYALFGTSLGAVVDRLHPRRAAIGNSLFAALVTGVQGVLVITGRASLGSILALSFLLGTSGSVEPAARQSLITQLSNHPSRPTP